MVAGVTLCARVPVALRGARAPRRAGARHAGPPASRVRAPPLRAAAPEEGPEEGSSEPDARERKGDWHKVAEEAEAEAVFEECMQALVDGDIGELEACIQRTEAEIRLLEKEHGIDEGMAAA